jgi:hypothetical protein
VPREIQIRLALVHPRRLVERVQEQVAIDQPPRSLPERWLKSHLHLSPRAPVVAAWDQPIRRARMGGAAVQRLRRVQL